jgi:uncharacterized membrane protein YesL
MLQNGWTGTIYRTCEWFMRLAYVNILWICFSLFGLILFGFFPATAAMFAVIRKWIMKETEIPVFKSFLAAWKKEFLASNILGFILFTIGYLLYADFLYLQENTGSLFQLAYYPLLIVFFIYVLVVFYVFPVFVHYDIKIFQVIKNAFFIVMLNPLANIMMIAGALGVYFVMIALPGLIPLFAGSVLTYVLMWCSYHAFIKMQRKHDQNKKILD